MELSNCIDAQRSLIVASSNQTLPSVLILMYWFLRNFIKVGKIKYTKSDCLHLADHVVKVLQQFFFQKDIDLSDTLFTKHWSFFALFTCWWTRSWIFNSLYFIAQRNRTINQDKKIKTVPDECSLFRKNIGFYSWFSNS